MYNKLIKFILYLILCNFSIMTASQDNISAYNFKFKYIDGEVLNLSQYENKVIVLVNVASQCGFTKQYEDMQKIWMDYENKGLILIGIPSNDFGSQEPGTNKEIKYFCETKFGITFPMTEKVSVIGPDAHPFYLWAINSYGKSSVPKWNFHKIIVGKTGKIEQTFSSFTNPSSKKFINYLEKLL